MTSTNRAQDLGRKRATYAAIGMASHWVLDRERSALLSCTDPHDGAYRTVHTITVGDGPVELSTPCGLARIHLARLLRR